MSSRYRVLTYDASTTEQDLDTGLTGRFVLSGAVFVGGIVFNKLYPWLKPLWHQHTGLAIFNTAALVGITVIWMRSWRGYIANRHIRLKSGEYLVWPPGAAATGTLLAFSVYSTMELLHLPYTDYADTGLLAVWTGSAGFCLYAILNWILPIIVNPYYKIHKALHVGDKRLSEEFIGWTGKYGSEPLLNAISKKGSVSNHLVHEVMPLFKHRIQTLEGFNAYMASLTVVQASLGDLNLAVLLPGMMTQIKTAEDLKIRSLWIDALRSATDVLAPEKIANYIERLQKNPDLIGPVANGPVPAVAPSVPASAPAVQSVDFADESAIVESLNSIVASLDGQTEDGYAKSLVTIKRFVDVLYGDGLNGVDKALMTAFFKTANPETKRRLLEVREILFIRGRALAKEGLGGTGILIRNPGAVQTAKESVDRIRFNLTRWYWWAMAYADAYVREHETADADNVKIVGKDIASEIHQDIFRPLWSAVDEIDRLVTDEKIDPYGVSLKLSRSSPSAKVAIHGRAARVGFLPMKGDPWQVGHIFVMLEAIASNRLDKLVIMVDNSDPERKPDLSSLAIREPITKELLKILEPFIVYTPLSKEEEDLRTADGERSIFRLMQWNRGLPIEWFYMVGSDHRHWEIPRGDKMVPDTAKKLKEHMSSETDGYAGEKLGIIFVERKGHEFAGGEIETLRAKAGIESITKILQPMDTSSTRVRKNKHWWTVPSDIWAMAQSMRFWGADHIADVSVQRFKSAA